MKALLQRIAGLAGYNIQKSRSPESECFLAFRSARDCRSRSDGSMAWDFIEHVDRNYRESRAQLFQDLLADFFCRTEGVFCEFGATDGLEKSNTWFLEHYRDWSGILAEPAPKWHQALRANRPGAIIDTRCVFERVGDTVEFLEPSDGEYGTILSFRDSDSHRGRRSAGTVRQVETITLNGLLMEHNIERLDYLSIDTEGSELEILGSFDINRFAPRLITIEHNYGGRRKGIYDIMSGNGYVRIFEEMSLFDDWYLREETFREFHKCASS